jgi:signal transduction histidine kinase
MKKKALEIEDSKKTKAELVIELSKLRKKISRLEKIEKQFKDLKEKLHEQSIEYEKLSALGRLTANVAHEIRNPITVIGGIARKLEEGVPSSKKDREYLKLIVHEADRLEEILRDAITFSDKGIFNRTESNINDIVKEILQLYGLKCKEHCISVQQSLGNVPIVYVDRKQLGEAILNIFQNSVEALPEGGKVEVVTEKKVFNRMNYVVIHISDNGIGIPQDEMNLIFEPFYTTKINQNETGLGLPIAKKIVEAHGGFIRLHSVVNSGTTFSIFLPYRSAEEKRLRMKHLAK